ncbi:Rossmann-like and DUF2520 domain-containing protein [Bacteroidota bacterium]
MQSRSDISSLSIIGAGNVGWHLAHAFYRAGKTIHKVYSRSAEKAEELAAKVNAIALTSLDDLSNDQDLLILCVTDDAIDPVIQALGKSPGKILHTAGSTGMEVFSGVESPHGVLYPLQTFTRGVDMDYSKIPFLIESSSERFTASIKKLAGLVSASVRVTNSADRLRIHIAAVFACNFGNHMAVLAAALLKEAGFDFELLLPLLEQTTGKLEYMNPAEAQTGPAARRDLATISRQLEALKEDRELSEIYKVLTESIIRNQE